MGVRLPAEYQEVEYLESNGSQYIITDYYPTSQSEITVKYLITSAPSGQKQIAGVINNRSGVNKSWTINFIRNSGTSITFAGNQISFNTNVQAVNTVYTAKISADGFYLNGTKMGDFGEVSEKVSDHPLYLFRENTVTSSSLSPMIGRIYEASTENPVFIPCYRKFDSKPGMYDPVEGKFYTNAGTGEFVVGPDVIDSISPWMVARRMVLMREPVIDTSPKIAEYGKRLNRSTGITNETGSCYTEWIDANPVSNTTDVSTQSALVFGGVPVSTTYVYQFELPNGSYDYWYTSKPLAGKSAKRYRFTLNTSTLCSAFCYNKVSGQIYFAGKDTQYFGYTNINDMPTGT
jgi:hypothetical protein